MEPNNGTKQWKSQNKVLVAIVSTVSKQRLRRNIYILRINTRILLNYTRGDVVWNRINRTRNARHRK